MHLAKFRLSLLAARFQLVGPGGPVGMASGKLAGLLAYLVCSQPVPQPRETLAALLWGSRSDVQARQNLRQALFRLRRALGEDVLIAVGEEISLRPGAFDSDAAGFEALIQRGGRESLARAIKLYRRPFLADLVMAEEGWSDWVTRERQRFEGLALDAMVKLSEMELGLGHASAALLAAREALAINNLREDAHRLVLGAMAAAGRRAEALKYYQDLVALLEHELNTEPDAATKALIGDLRRTHPRSGSPAAEESVESPASIPDSGGSLAKGNIGHASGEVAASGVRIPSGGPERRQLTILACRVARPVPAPIPLDPEDIHASMAAFHKMVTDVVSRFNGLVARYRSDGVSIYFGYPTAHERDPEQAIRAALAILAALGTLGAEFQPPLQAKLGVATGVVVVSKPPGSGAPQQIVAIGETPFSAARMAGAATAGQIVIDAGTRRLVEGRFDCRPLAAVAGSEHPEAWHVCGEAQDAATVSRFVGRQEEIDLLMHLWEEAKAGEGWLVALSGDPGVGKSRLAAELAERVAGEPQACLRYFCAPERTDSALFPIISHIERAAGLAHDDMPEARLDKLDSLLARTWTSLENAAIFAEMLAVPNDGRYPALELPPQRRRAKTMEALLSRIEALSRESPVLMIVEDAQWIDPTTREAVDRLLGRLHALRVLLIVTFRPEFDPPWTGHPYTTLVAVNRLARPEVGLMIDQVVGDKVLPAKVRRDIVVRADGIPLFVEEMTKAVLEMENRDSPGHMGSVPSLAAAVPVGLNATLMARLDRLGGAKEIAQVGAAIGREFSHALLAAVTGKSEAEVQVALDRLIVAGLLFRQGTPPQAVYMFKHALVQQAAYGALLRGQRRALHARIAEALANQFADVVEGWPELLAHHCAEAGHTEKAAVLWCRAGERSLERSALAEAAEQFAHAIEQLEALPATPARRRERIKLQVALLTPLVHVNGFAAPETVAAVERARLLIEEAEAFGEPPEDPLLLFSVLYGFWAANCVAFNGDAICSLAAQFLALAEKQGTAAPLMVGHRLMGVSLMCTGGIAESRVHYDRALALYDPDEHRAIATRFGNDTEVVVLGFRSWAQWLLGYPEAAVKDADGALGKAREIGRTPTLMFALWLVTIPHILAGDCAVAIARLQEDFALAAEKGASPWKAIVMAFRGCALALAGDASDAVDMITAGIAAWRSTGSTVGVPLYLSYLASANMELGKFDDARRCIAEATSLIETTKETWFEAEIHRVAGEFALRAPEADAAKAEACFERALAVARQQQAKSLELRAATSMARLWRDQGERHRARDLLFQIYGWFTEGLGTSDLREAEALLGSLVD